jgi:hypothetical protein
MHRPAAGYLPAMDRRQGSRSRRTLTLLLVVAPLLVACTGKPAGTSAWQSSTDRVLGTAIAGLGTARLVVQAEVRGDLPHTYAVVTATDAIDTSTKEVATYVVGQPPDRLHRAHREVSHALQDAVALMVEVRVALASPGVTRAAARQLVDAIDAMRHRLDDLDTAVQEAPATVGAS